MKIVIELTEEDEIIQTVFEKFNNFLVLERNTAVNWDDLYDQIFLRLQDKTTNLVIDISKISPTKRGKYKIVSIADDLVEEIGSTVTIVR